MRRPEYSVTFGFSHNDSSAGPLLRTLAGLRANELAKEVGIEPTGSTFGAIRIYGRRLLLDPTMNNRLTNRPFSLTHRIQSPVTYRNNASTSDLIPPPTEKTRPGSTTSHACPSGSAVG